jgi:hypothetical protein
MKKWSGFLSLAQNIIAEQVAAVWMTRLKLQFPKPNAEASHHVKDVIDTVI